MTSHVSFHLTVEQLLDIDDYHFTALYEEERERRDLITRFANRDIRLALYNSNRDVFNLYTLLTIQGFPIPYNVNVEDIPESDMSLIEVFLEIARSDCCLNLSKESMNRIQQLMGKYGFSWP